jgi:hypothetical protein
MLTGHPPPVGDECSLKCLHHDGAKALKEAIMYSKCIVHWDGDNHVSSN